jgi:hypothetical protein
LAFNALSTLLIFWAICLIIHLQIHTHMQNIPCKSISHHHIFHSSYRSSS